MFCKECLKQIIPKLTSGDIYILEYLYKENAKMAQCSISPKTIFNNMGEGNLNQNNVYTSLKRLNQFGFVETQMWTKKSKYYITDDGINLLEIIQKKLNE